MSLRNVSAKDREEMLVKNRYLDNIEEGMNLITKLLAVKEEQDSIDQKFDYLNKLIEEDYVQLAEKSNVRNEVHIVRKMDQTLDTVEEMIKFPFLSSKQVVAVGGAFSAGKSTFVNSILGEKVLPTDTTPTTSIPTYIASGDERSILAYNVFGKKVKIDKEAVDAISHAFNKKYNLSFTKILKKIILQSSNFGYQNITFLDTPGYTKADSHKTEDNTDEAVAREHLSGADYLIWLIDIENGTIKEEDIEFIKKLEFDKPILFVFNKADKKPERQIKNIIKVAEKNLRKAGIKLDASNQIIAYSSIEGEEYCGNKLLNFLKEVNSQSKKVDVLDEFKDAFRSYREYHQDIITNKDIAIKNLKEKLGYHNQKILEISSGEDWSYQFYWEDKWESFKSEFNNDSDDSYYNWSYYEDDLRSFHEENVKELRDEIIDELKERINDEKQIKSKYESLLKEFEELNEEFEKIVKSLLDSLNVNYSNIEELSHSLLSAISDFNFNKAEKLIERGTDINVRDNKGRNSLLLLDSFLDKEITEEYIKNKVRIDFMDDYRVKVIVKDRDEVKMKTIIEADDKLIGLEEEELIYKALAKVKENLFKKIINASEELKNLDDSYSNINELNLGLLEAINNFNFNKAEKLIDRGADVGIKDKEGSNLLFLLVSFNDREIKEECIKNIVEIDFIDNYKARVVVRSKDEIKMKSIIEEDDKLTELEREELIYKALNKSKESLFAKIINAGGELDFQDEEETVLIKAIESSKYNLAEILIKAGANLDLKDNKGETALMKLADYSTDEGIEIAKLLLEAGVNLEARDENGETALMKLANYSTDVGIEIAKLLLEVGVNLEARDENGETALFKVANNSFGDEILKLLIDAGAELDVRCGYDNEAPLMKVAGFVTGDNRTRKVKMLIEGGAELDLQDDGGETALMKAIMFKNKEVIKLLIKAGANSNIKDDFGNTALMKAIMFKNKEVIKLLIKAGVNLNIEDDNGNTALDSADDKEIIKILVDAGAKGDSRTTEELIEELKELEEMERGWE